MHADTWFSRELTKHTKSLLKFSHQADILSEGADNSCNGIDWRCTGVSNHSEMHNEA